ncbi:hypothetical protein ASD21_02930 [Caulobacter sp. Root1455]|uniref:hypothetical protein n=1 Tax=unclassified Caulobacter TaxID=2648921 RepID=UPI0006F4D591|nr:MULTISPECIES: hypothetical protein [unclassified Caulobacter]KQY28774.1 hypothetical protein ASD38_14085 [Caulobacter sp. Root487D2Y]KQY98931.1 hypothetical protein ASD21_02930 [Caulobacter sp. Root1455]
MIRVAASVVLAVGLLASPATAADKPPARQMGWLSQTVRTVVVFNSCTARLKEKFKIGPLNGIEVTHMDANGGDPSGAMDVNFEAVTTEKKTQRRSRFVGVCHIGAEGETRIDARLVSQNSGGVVRRVPAGKVAG